jgi:putative membrane protein
MQWWCVAQGVPWTWQWQPYPGVWLFVLALVAGYATVRRLRPDDEETPTWRTACFAAGAVALWVALDWPVGALGAGYLASVHMVQFLLIALVAPPLLLLGMPPASLRRFARAPGVRGALQVVTQPLVAIVFFSVTMAWTHWPVVVDAWMSAQIGSFGLDLAWLLSGLVLWWPVVAPEPARYWFGYPGKMGYLILATIVNTGIFMYLTYAELPLYRIYELAPPVSWLTTRQDQVLAMRGADLAKTVFIRQVGDGIHLLRRGIARRHTRCLQRYHNDPVARNLMGHGIMVEPSGEIRIRRQFLVKGVTP